MKRIMLVVMIIMVVSLSFTVPAYAKSNMPVDACPSGFELMNYMDGNHTDMQMHIGLAMDLNGDGYICMEIISPDLHLHVDNTLTLP
jgi:hypothetical protein